jgi:3alpha(or 20beta)-hydroxysteroid dehydrogenase
VGLGAAASVRDDPPQRLVNCAGVMWPARGEVTAADLEGVQALGPLLGIQALAPLMGPGASIVNVGSVAALQGPLSGRVHGK